LYSSNSLPQLDEKSFFHPRDLFEIIKKIQKYFLGVFRANDLQKENY